MKVVCISDCHGKLPTIPPCDVLLIAGDLCPHVPSQPILAGGQVARIMRPHVGSPADVQFQGQWLDTVFRRWLSQVPAAHVVATWGNHDWVAQKRPEIIPALPWHLLVDSGVEAAGLRIWGSPWQTHFYDWAFNAPPGLAGETFLAEKYAAIPHGTDILITHGPPRGYGDRTAAGHLTGSTALDEFLTRRPLRLVVTGHIHEGYGTYRHPSGTTIVNASVLNAQYELTNAPIVLDW